MTRRFGRFLRVLLILAAVAAPARAADRCVEWSRAATVGRLDPAVLHEASGLAVSRRHPGRLYHVNDSGNEPRVYVTNESGENDGTLEIEGFEPEDVEDLALGRCPHGPRRDCLYVGDIGDNDRRRDSIHVVVIEEPEMPTGKLRPVAEMRLSYPEGPTNAEGMALHPNGDLFILTKEEDLKRTMQLLEGTNVIGTVLNKAR